MFKLFHNTSAGLKILLTGLFIGIFAYSQNSFAQTLKIGVTPGIQEKVAEQVAPLLKEKGYTLEIITFSNYALPNEALNNGDIDINSFQHSHYLKNSVEKNKYALTPIGQTFLGPMGLYSKKISSLDALPKNALIGIPNDPANGERALKLLESFNLIELEKTDTPAAPENIKNNPKSLKIIELDASMIARSLPDLDLAAINTNFAVDAGLLPKRDALVRESENSPYVNVLVVQTKHKDAPWIQDILSAYHSEKIKNFVLETYKGAVLPVF